MRSRLNIAVRAAGCALVLATMVLTSVARGEDLRLGSPFSDHMVLQRDQAIRVWGWADAGETVTVSFAGQSKQAKADDKGRWMAALDALPASAEARSLEVRGATDQRKLVLADVLVGEVWVCSGQSNMQWPLALANDGPAEIAAAKFPNIRLFTVPNVTAATPRDTCGGTWEPCQPGTAGSFSAVGYFFGRHLHQQLNVPVGLIDTSWGGTVAEAWTSREALLARLPEFRGALDQLEQSEANIAKAMETYKQKVAEHAQALQKLYDLEDDSSGAGAFANPDVDDSDWKTLNTPGNWELSPDFRNVDGILWLRRTVTLPAEWAGKDLVLRPGPIDEVDVTYFNGVQVGARGNMRKNQVEFWNQPRDYAVPGKLVKAGANVIAIRAMDASGQGGLWGAPAETMYVAVEGEPDGQRVPLAGQWRIKAEYVLPPRPSNPINPNRPSVLFNAMVQPLIPFGIRGAIWYQGESNAGRAVQYRTLLPTMISDWRSRWNSGPLPFLIVQLANYRERHAQPVDTAWAMLREAQAMTAETMTNAGLALAIDIGDAKDIHPRNKQEVGRRLGLSAQAIAYGQDVAYSGPVFDKRMILQGGKAVLAFRHTSGGLVAREGPLTGFAIAGADRKFVWANAEIRDDRVLVWSDQVAEPIAVRYAWDDDPACNLYNGAGLPAVPFRTDDW